MAFPCDEVQFQLPEQCGKLSLPGLYPRKPREHKGPDDLGTPLHGREYGHSAVRRIHGDVNVLDGVAVHGNPHTADLKELLRLTHRAGRP